LKILEKVKCDAHASKRVYHQQITSFIPCDLGFALLFLMIRYAFLLKTFVPHFLGLSHLLGVDKYAVYNEFKRISKVGHFTQSNFHDIDLPSQAYKSVGSKEGGLHFSIALS